MKTIHPRDLMKTALFLFFICSITACTKDKNDNPEIKVTPPAKQISIADLKNLSKEQSVKIKDSGVIRGVVISDASEKNVDNTKTLFLQEGTGKEGIMISLKTDHNFLVNDSLEINILGQTLTTINGTVLLQDLGNELIKKIGAGKIVPRETTVSELKAHKADWEGSLIRIKACELISDNGNYSANTKIRDGYGTLSAKIFGEAKFSGKVLPVDINSVLGIVRINGDEVQVAPRNLSEVVPLKYLTDDFTTWKNTTWSSNLELAEVALYTQFAKWHGNLKDGAIKQLATPADAVFLKAGKIYPYLPKDSIASSLDMYPADNMTLKDVKVLRITFAASKSVGNVRFLEQSVGNQEIPVNILPFNTGTDEVMIGVQVPIESTGEAIPGKLATPKGFDDYYKLQSLTSSFKESGKFYTAVFFIPSKMEDLQAMGITVGNRQQWIDNPKLTIINRSSRKTSGISIKHEDRYIPVIIDKVEMGF